MALDPRIILAGQPLDVVGAMRQGNAAAAETNALRQQNQLTNLYQTQGAGIMAGDQNALNALAGIDPVTALNIQGTRQDMTYKNRQLEVLNAQEARALEEYKLGKDAAALAAEAQAIENAVKVGLALPDAASWDQYMTQNNPDLVGQFGNRQALAQKYMTMAEVLKQNEKPAPLTDQGKAAFDAQNGWITPEQAASPPVDPKAATEIRKEFAGLQPVKNFAVQSDAYAKIVSAAKDPSAAGDLALIFSFMKMLDPTSVVREQEFANAQNAAGVPERLRAAYNNVLTGERLTPSTRADFLSQTQAIYAGAEQEYANIEKQYRALAERQNIPVQDALINFRYSGPKYTPPVAMRDLAQAGITGQGTPAPTQDPQSGPIVIDGYTIEAIQ